MGRALPLLPGPVDQVPNMLRQGRAGRLCNATVQTEGFLRRP